MNNVSDFTPAPSDGGIHGLILMGVDGLEFILHRQMCVPHMSLKQIISSEFLNTDVAFPLWRCMHRLFMSFSSKVANKVFLTYCAGVVSR